MAHFAKINNGIVEQVIVAEQDFVDTLEGKWVQTSYNTKGGKHYNTDTFEEDDGTPLRYNFASVGDTYDSDAQAFYESKPYATWTLNTDTYLWEAPIEKPSDCYSTDSNGHKIMYYWDDASYYTDNTKGWVKYPDK